MTRKHWHVIVGVTYVFIGLSLRRYVLGAESFAEPIHIHARARVLLAIVQVTLVVLGALTISLRGSHLIQRMNVVLASALVLGLPGAELVLRLSFLPASSPTRAPHRFANDLHDEDFWILDARWSKEGAKIAPERVQAELGWCQTHVTPDNPLGISFPSRQKLKKDGRPKALFLGDSYVGGHARPENLIPNYIDARLPGVDVVHLGVGGYGTDQAHLLLLETIELVERPFVIMGVMVFDFDRAVLAIRTYQKPLYSVNADGRLSLGNLPIDPDPVRFFQRTELHLDSFLLAGARRWFFPDHDPRHADKVAINRALIAANKDLTQSAGLGLLYVLFHPERDLMEEDWRSAFFREELERREIDCFDTRAPLLAYLSESGVRSSALYIEGHHNDLGNQIIGDALVKRLRELGLE